MCLERKGLLASLDIPDLYRAVTACRSQAPAVRAEGDAIDRSPMLPVRDQLLAGRAIPNLHHVVTASRRQAPAIWAESHAMYNMGMIDGHWLLGVFQIPDLHLAVEASRCQTPAVGAECHGLDPSGMSLEGADLLPGRAVPNLHRLVHAA